MNNINLKDINIEDIWNKNSKVIIGIAIFLLTIILANKVIYQPQTKKIKSLEAWLLEETRKNELADEINRLQDKINFYRQKTSVQKESSWLINELFGITKDIKVEVVSFQPQSIEEKKRYARLPLKITIKAKYHQLGRFLSRLEGFERFIRVDSLQVEGVEVSGADSEKTEELKTTLVISGVYLK